MPERSTIAQRVQIGVESQQGTAVAATKNLLALSIGLNVAEDVHTFQPKGAKYPTVVYNGREWADCDVAGDATYSEIQYPMSSALCSPVTSQLLDGATPTGAYRWVYDPLTFGADTVKTYTVEQGDNVRAHRAANMIVTAFGLRWDRKGVTITGDGYAAAIEDGIALTSSGVTSIPTVPIQPTQLDVYLDNTIAGLGTTKQLRVLSGEWGVTGRFASLFVVDSSQPSFVAHVEKDPGSTFKLKVEADAQGMANLNKFRTAQTQYLRLTAKGPKIYSGTSAANDVYYSLQVDVAGKVSAVSKFEDSDGVYAVEFTFTTVHDATWGKAYHIELVNNQSAL
jgi:hypothetical protein